MYASKVMAVCPHCGKPTRLGHKLVTKDDKTKSVRVCKNENCGKEF